MAKRKPYSKHTPNQRVIKGRAVRVAAFVIDLQMRVQDIKEGKGSYKEPLPADATNEGALRWAEVFASEGEPRRGSILKQAANEFGVSTKQISRYLKLVEQEGWFSEVRAELEGDDDRLAAWLDDIKQRRDAAKLRAARSGITFMRSGGSITAAVRRRRRQGAARAP
jgi:hypothetical protein